MKQTLSKSNNIVALLDFFENSQQRVCFVEGKEGFFKTFFVNEALNKKQPDLIFRIKCFGYTTIDDIFLSLLTNLKEYTKEKKLSFTKIETNQISDRINYYLSHINSPAVFVIDSLENILDNSEVKDRDEIFRFFEHLSAFENFKLVIISTKYTNEFLNIFENKNFQTKKIEMNALTKEETKKLFDDDVQFVDEEDLSYFFDISKGNPSYIFCTLNILSTLKINITSLLSEYQTKQISFKDYLLQKITTFIPENIKQNVILLSFFNGGISRQYLINEKFFTNEQITYLVEKGILIKEDGLIFIKEDIKKQIQKSLVNLDKEEYHKKWLNFYESQLPLKPTERDILISRKTMRAQIEYHNSFLSKDVKNKAKPDMSLISYLNSDITAWNYPKTNVEKTDNIEKDSPQSPELIKNNKVSNLAKYELTKEEIRLLGLPVELNTVNKSQQKPLVRTVEQQDSFIEETKEIAAVKKTITDYYKTARDAELSYDIETAISVYLQILSMTDDKDFDEYQPKVLEHIADCCINLNKTTEAIDFYNKLVDLYSHISDNENVNKIKLKIANIYKKTYKNSHARVIYENFVKNKAVISNDILAQAYINLADIEETQANTYKASEYYQSAFKIYDEKDILLMDETKKNLLACAYYRYACILDSFNKTDDALYYYQKCTEISPSESIETSSSYANIAEIYLIRNDEKQAVEYFKTALKQDLKIKNYEGIYYISLKLAIIFEQTNQKQTLNWLLKSLSAAKKTKDRLYIANAYLEMGDFYSNTKEYNKAFTFYLKANKINGYDDNNSGYDVTSQNISDRIERTKKHLSQDVIENIIREIDNNE